MNEMKVYVAERGYDYEGTAILGIFTSSETAWKTCDEDIHTFGNGRTEPKGDFYEVSEHIINSPKEGVCYV
ncbi:hypothetical protein KAR91_67165 [Candidatus Pacearchaeota archaeon]|nr:hypothetical protein [Candidatus Pacearchaeota archaeon]